MAILAGYFKNQRELEANAQLVDSQLVAYALNVGYDKFIIASNTALQQNSERLSRGCLLAAFAAADHFVLLRVSDVVNSPLYNVEQQMLYELGKRGIPELDQVTRTDNSWYCLSCDVLGSYYEHNNTVFFAGDIPGLFSALDYRIYTISQLAPIVINGQYRLAPGQSGFYRATEYSGNGTPLFIPIGEYASIGYYRPTEVYNEKAWNDVLLYPQDLIDHRTAFFGKTRSGKSNSVKVITSALIKYNRTHPSHGQLIIDTNGEYANDNPQDGICLANRFPSECVVYSISPRSGTHILRCNFYNFPDQAMSIMQERISKTASTYISAFLSVPIPSFSEVTAMTSFSEKIRAIRKIQMLYVVFHIAGFAADQATLERIVPKITSGHSVFDPCFSAKLRNAIHSTPGTPSPSSLSELVDEYHALKTYYDNNPEDPLLKTSSGNPLLDTDDLALLKFAFPKGSGSGPNVLKGLRTLHDARANDFLKDILDYLDDNKTVILDMSNAPPTLITFLSDRICTEIFHHQEDLFTRNKLGNRHLLLYAEEAHNYFPAKDDNTGIYARIAKEGAKYNIGLIYSTQSPSTISGELLSQTENFFVAHLDSTAEIDSLSRRSSPFSGVAPMILHTRTPGYLYMLTASQRYPIPVQIRNFSEVSC